MVPNGSYDSYRVARGKAEPLVGVAIGDQDIRRGRVAGVPVFGKLYADNVLEGLEHDPDSGRFVEVAPDPLAGAGGRHELVGCREAVGHVAVGVGAVDLVAGGMPDVDLEGDR